MVLGLYDGGFEYRRWGAKGMGGEADTLRKRGEMAGAYE